MKKMPGVLAATVFLLIAALVLCGKYGRRNRELSAMVAVRDETIEAYASEIERQQSIITQFQTQWEQQEPTAEYETKTGFVKKDGVYLIDSMDQMRQLKQLIAEGKEIEPGAAAADAYYRLRSNLQADDWFYLGTEEHPFRGRFDGDGKTISGKFPFMEGADVPEALFLTDESARIENLSVENEMKVSSETAVSVTVENDRDCAELEANLERFPDCRVDLEIKGLEVDMRRIADMLRERWQRNREQKDYFVNVSICVDSREQPDAEMFAQMSMDLWGMLPEKAYEEILAEALEQEEGYLRVLRLERVKELNCCSFEIGGPDGRTAEGYHVILEGNWDETEVPAQHFYIPYTPAKYGIGTYVDIWPNDVDFDGKQDLLFLEGYYSGTGGSGTNFRAVIWNDRSGRFESYPSFPEYVTSLELDRRRVVYAQRMGIEYEAVTIYEIVDGKYVPTRELIDEFVYDSERGDYTEVLSYYEMGELVRTHILSDEDEKAWLYPDMDYWRKG